MASFDRLMMESAAKELAAMPEAKREAWLTEHPGPSDELRKMVAALLPREAPSRSR